MLLVRQGEQAWMLGGPKGNHEFARAFYASVREGEDPHYIVRDGKARVGGGIDLTHISVDADGATFTWSTGHKSFIPQDYFQVTWLP